MRRLVPILLLAAALLLAATPLPRPAHWNAPHPRFSTEWWYFTGNLRSPDGRAFGFELTFFRVSPTPAADLRHDLYFTDFAITDAAAGRYFDRERAHRGDWLQAGADANAHGELHLWNENWSADFDPSGPRHLAAAWDGHTLALDLVPGARILNGLQGWSQKGPGPTQGSFYSSYPHIAASGRINGVAVAGLAWMDHEFSTAPLAGNQQGWDWMGLHLGAGDLMLFDLRQTSGARDPHSAGTWKPRNRPAQPFTAADFTMQPLRWWRGYPVAWRVRVPRFGLDFTVTAWRNDQEFRATALGVNYWEGAVSVRGAGGGEGYLELTGYGQRFRLLQSPRPPA